jgi:general secretion pathway protein G
LALSISYNFKKFIGIFMRNGLTLIELMIVIIILGLLASLVMPNLIGQSDEAKKKLVCIQMKSISESLKTFKLYNGVYPATEEGLEALAKNPDPEKYTDYPSTGFLDDGRLPKDPWGGQYIYTNSDSSFNLISLGADGKEGGESENRDITFESCQR